MRCTEAISRSTNLRSSLASTLVDSSAMLLLNWSSSVMLLVVVGSGSVVLGSLSVVGDDGGYASSLGSLPKCFPSVGRSLGRYLIKSASYVG